MDELLTLSAIDLAARIARRDVSPVEVVDAHLDRIADVNDALNAVVVDLAEPARRAARAAEVALRRGRSIGPLHGVPCTIKEMIAVAGQPSTIGSLPRRDARAPRDATVVARLRAAGAIVMGLTNLPEVAFWMETANLIYGRTNNPHDLARTPGGSSGGEAAIVAAGGSPFGLGSDGAGSIRIPTSFCGVFGHKPSAGLVPLTGHYPLLHANAGENLGRVTRAITIGPIVRRAEDLMPLLRILAGPDGGDPQTAAITLGEPDAIDFAGRKVLVLEDPRLARTARAAPQMRAATRRAANALAERGARVEEWQPPAELREAFAIWEAMFADDYAPSLAETVGGDRAPRLVRQFAAKLIGRSSHTLPSLLFCVGERLRRHAPAKLQRSRAAGARLRESLLASLGDGGVLLMPPHPRPAPRHHALLLHPLDFLYAGLWNVLEVPATCAPIGRDARGLPLSVQIIGPPHRDDLTIAAAIALERACGGWIPAESIERAT